MPQIKKDEWYAIQSELKKLRHEQSCHETEVEDIKAKYQAFDDVVKEIALREELAASWTNYEGMNPWTIRHLILDHIKHLQDSVEREAKLNTTLDNRVQDLQYKLDTAIQPLKDKIIELVMGGQL